jgi:hypothetical protein
MENKMSVTHSEEALREVLSAVMHHKYAKTEEASKIWFQEIRKRLKNYYNAIASEHYGSK